MGDSERTFSEDEQQALTERLVRLLTAVHEGVYSDRYLDEALLREIHREVFEGIRSHAGRCRSDGNGSEYLQFGPNRSAHRSEVAARLAIVFREARSLVVSCEENPSAPNYERAAFFIAVRFHAQVIQIHPFEDGNGRTCRALLNIVLVRLGLPPVVVEVPKQEYCLTLNHFFKTSELDPLVDLLLPCCTDDSA